MDELTWMRDTIWQTRRERNDYQSIVYVEEGGREIIW